MKQETLLCGERNQALKLHSRNSGIYSLRFHRTALSWEEKIQRNLIILVISKYTHARYYNIIPGVLTLRFQSICVWFCCIVEIDNFLLMCHLHLKQRSTGVRISERACLVRWEDLHEDQTTLNCSEAMQLQFQIISRVICKYQTPAEIIAVEVLFCKTFELWNISQILSPKNI